MNSIASPFLESGPAMEHASRSGAPILCVDRVGKVFGAHRVLEEVSFQMRAGEVIAIIGPSGSGKARCCDVSISWSRPRKAA